MRCQPQMMGEMTNTIRTPGFIAMIDAIIAARKAAKMTQRDLAIRLSCLPSTIDRIETGQRRIDVVELVALAEALSLDPRDLLEIVMRKTESSDLKNNFSRSTRSRTTREK